MQAPSEYLLISYGFILGVVVRIYLTFLTHLALSLVTSSSINYILNVILPSISFAALREGAITPLRTHSCINTFSTRGCGLTVDLNYKICAFVSARIACSAACIASIYYCSEIGRDFKGGILSSSSYAFLFPTAPGGNSALKWLGLYKRAAFLCKFEA